MTRKRNRVPSSHRCSPGPRWRPRPLLIAAVVVAVATLLVWTILSRDPTSPERRPPVAGPTSGPGAKSESTAAPPTGATNPTVDATEPLVSATVDAPTPSTFARTVSPSLPQEEPAPTGGHAAGNIALNDAQFIAPTGWSIYGDEMIEGDRRAVRLSQDTTGARLQAVTLEPTTADLASSCGSLITLQQAQFTEVSRQLVVGMGVDPELGTAARCGFSGNRTSDGINNTVTFTLIMRASDSHVLLLRHTVPDAMEAKVLGVAQLNAMTCDASSSFGVPLPLC